MLKRNIVHHHLGKDKSLIDRKFYSSQLYDIAPAPKILFYQFSDQCDRSINASRSLRGISRQ